MHDNYIGPCGRALPPEGGFPPEEFFRIPQYNTWIELQYNQNQEGVLQYAQGILEHGHA